MVGQFSETPKDGCCCHRIFKERGTPKAFQLKNGLDSTDLGMAVSFCEVVLLLTVVPFLLMLFYPKEATHFEAPIPFCCTPVFNGVLRQPIFGACLRPVHVFGATGPRAPKRLPQNGSFWASFKTQRLMLTPYSSTPVY